MTQKPKAAKLSLEANGMAYSMVIQTFPFYHLIFSRIFLFLFIDATFVEDVKKECELYAKEAFGCVQFLFYLSSNSPS